MVDSLRGPGANETEQGGFWGIGWYQVIFFQALFKLFVDFFLQLSRFGKRPELSPLTEDCLRGLDVFFGFKPPSMG